MVRDNRAQTDRRVAAGEEHWANRFVSIVPARHQERLAKEAPGAELVIYPDGGHGVTNRAYESRSRMADWLADHLKG